jgi:hypothetical protein
VSVNNFSTTVPSVSVIVLEIPFIFIPPISGFLIYDFKLHILVTERFAPVSKRIFILFSSHKSTLNIRVSKLDLTWLLHSWILSEEQPTVSWSRQSVGRSQTLHLHFPSCPTFILDCAISDTLCTYGTLSAVLGDVSDLWRKNSAPLSTIVPLSAQFCPSQHNSLLLMNTS